MSEMPPPPPMPMQGQPAGGPPQDYTTLAIVAMIIGLCTSCIGLITGIIAVVQANKAKSLYAAGDVPGSYSAANTAKILVFVTFGLAALGLLVNLILFASGNFYYNVG